MLDKEGTSLAKTRALEELENLRISQQEKTKVSIVVMRTMARMQRKGHSREENVRLELYDLRTSTPS